jgi:hypothetical protein
MATKEAEKLEAKEAIVVVVGARPIEYQRRSSETGTATGS